MRIETLLSPGILANGIRLRTESAKAISSVEVTAARTPGGKCTGAGKLAAFFTDAASRLAGLYETTLPTVSSRVAASTTVLNITFNEAMDQSVLPLPTAFTSSGNTIGSLRWASSTVLEITGTGFVAADTISYTKPTVNFLRDVSNNGVATFTTQAIA